jgi:AAHS family 4-hydroxybenzoate transporter-like MFS transporter
LFTGQAVDRYNRKLILGLACFGWGLSTFLSGTVATVYGIALCRFMTGVFMSAFDPARFSIVNDLFPIERQAMAVSVMTSSIFPGAGLATLSVIPLVRIGWRSTLQVVGVSAMIIGSMFLLFVKEPKRQR